MKKKAAAVPGGVMKPARPAKPAAPKRVTVPAHKAASSKHKPAASPKHKAAGTAKHNAKTGLALHPDDVQCCAAQALAASLRLVLGTAVHQEDMLALYWRTASHPDEGASILDTLKAAREYGLAGPRPRSLTSLTCGNVMRDPRNCRSAAGPGLPRVKHGLILRLELPAGPHAVLADGKRWWSWGEPYDPADFGNPVISEAWAVAWS